MEGGGGWQGRGGNKGEVLGGDEDGHEVCWHLLQQVERDMGDKKKAQVGFLEGKVVQYSDGITEQVLQLHATSLGTVGTCKRTLGSDEHEKEDSYIEEACMQWLDAYEKGKACI